MSGAFAGCNRSRAWQPAPGLVDVELHADELEGTALQSELRGGVQTTSRNSLSLSTKNRWLRASGGLAKRAPSPLPLIRCQGLPSMHGTA